MRKYHKFKNHCFTHSAVLFWTIVVVLFFIMSSSVHKFIKISNDCTDVMNSLVSLSSLKDSGCAENGLKSIPVDDAESSSVATRVSVIDPSFVMKIKKVENDTRDVFDANVLTYLISFVLVAVLTLILNQSDKYRREIEAFRQEVNALKCEALVVNRMQYHLSQTNKVYSDCLLICNIVEMNSGFKKNGVLFNAISCAIFRWREFLPKIPEYHKDFKDEVIFSIRDIEAIRTPLEQSNTLISDVILMREKKIKDSGKDNAGSSKFPNDLLNEAKSIIELLIKRYDSYRQAPINRMKVSS